jgi:TRAP-type C4-dicarboxylate transport system permease small subunit
LPQGHSLKNIGDVTMSNKNKKDIRKVLNDLNEYLLLFIFCIIITVMLSNIIARVLGQCFQWAEELCRYLFIYLVFGGAALAFRKGLFISIDIIENVLPKKARIFVAMICEIVILGFFITVCYLEILFIQVTWTTRSPAMMIPMRYVYIALSVFFAQLSFFSIDRIIRILKNTNQVNHNLNGGEGK